MFAYCLNNPVNRCDTEGNLSVPSWLKKAIAVTAVAATVVVATALTVSTFGFGSIAGVAMVSATATLAVKSAEVATLQTKKGISEGKNATQLAKDAVESIYNNGLRIIGLLPVTKTAGIAANSALDYMIDTSIGIDYSFASTLKSAGGKALAYGMVAYNAVQAVKSARSSNPVDRASERGYTLL